MPKPERTPTGKFRIRYTDPDGKRRCRTFPTAKAARDWWAVESASMVKKEWLNPDLGARLLSDWAEEVFTIKEPVRRRNTQNLNRQYYRTVVEPRWGSTALGDIERDKIILWVAELSDPTKNPKARWDADLHAFVRDGGRFSSETIRKIWNTFRTIVIAAVDAGLIGNPLPSGKQLPLPEMTQKTERFLNDDEVVRLAVSMRDRYRAMVYVCCYGGLRMGEAAALQLADIDWDGNRVRVHQGQTEVGDVVDYEAPKTAAGRRWVPLVDKAMRHLRDHVDEFVGWEDAGAYVFRSPNEKVFRIRTWRRREWYPAVAAAGLDRLTPHDMRHTAAALHIAEGCTRWELVSILGHKDSRMIDRVYGHLFPDDREDLRQRMSRRAEAAAGEVTRLRRVK